MSEKEKAIASFKERALEVMIFNAPIVPTEGRVIVQDATKYTALKNGIQDKMREINAPLLTDKEKWDVIMSIEDQLDEFIRKRGMVNENKKATD